MDIASRLARGAAVILIVGCASPYCFAGDKEQVELMEQAVAQFESLNAAAGEMSAILERVTDAQSADGVVNELEPVAKKFVAEIEKAQAIIQRGAKEASGQIQSAEYQARAQAAAQKQPTVVQEWQTQAARLAKEVNRIAGVKGLSPSFAKVFRAQVGAVMLSMQRAMKGMDQPQAPSRSLSTGSVNPRSIDTAPGGAPGRPSSNLPLGAPNAQQTMGYDQLVGKYGKDRLVRVEVTNYAEVRAHSEAIWHEISEAAIGADRGPVLPSQPGEAVTSSWDSANGVAYAAPVSNFDGFCKLLNFAQIVERNDAERLVRIKIDPAKIGTGMSDNNPFAGFYRMYVDRYGKDKVVRVKVVNQDTQRGDYHFAEVALSSLHTEIHMVDGSSGYGIVAPVRDFDVFCKSLRSFAEIVERNDAEKIVKIRVDQAKAKLVEDARRAPASNREEFNRRDGSGDLADRSTTRQELPAPSDPDYQKKLCELMVNDASWPLNEKAVDAVLLLKPAHITDKAVRKQIAVNFRTLATTEGHHIDAGKAIRGLVLYGGKYSVPILVEILKREQFKVPRELFDGLAQYPDVRGAEAVVPQLANAFNREAAASTIRTMGPVAEDALVTIAPSDDPAVSLAAVKLLGEVGTEKCVPLLGKAARSSNADVADAAKASLTAIRQRTQKPAAVAK